MADDGDQVATAASLHPRHAEAAVDVVKGDPLDEPGERFAAGMGRAAGDDRYLPRFPARFRFGPAAASRNRLPILKRTAVVAGICNVSPVRRLRPRRALRW